MMPMKEETAIILDFLPSGYPDRRHAEPVAQAVGNTFFSLLEIIPREGVQFKPEEEVYIGEGKRDKVRFIKSSLEVNQLTRLAQSVLPEIIAKIVANNEKRFLEFFNKAGMITPRMHQFQLLSGVGKKHLIDILDERKKKPFESFADMLERVKLFPEPGKIITKRIMDELSGNEKYYLFVPKKKRE